jgi:flagellar assembly protein FliH
MAPKIIKQGSERASCVQRFSFLDQISELKRSMEDPIWPALSTATDPCKVAVAAQATSDSGMDPVEIERAAYEKGYQQGEKAGLEVAEKKAEAIMKRYAESLLEVEQLKRSLYAQSEQELVKLAIEVAKKIVHREIRADRDIIQTLVRVALSHIGEKSAVTVLLNPVDYAYLLEQRAELSQTEGRDISLLADKSIERGGCLIQTECGDIDARIEQKFQEVEHAFFEDLK